MAATKIRPHKFRLATADTRHMRPEPKKADPAYQTQDHLRWRADVVARAGGRCEDPRHPPGKPRSGIRLFADHIVELRDGGQRYDLTNGMARCGGCHTRKTMRERARRMAAD